MTPASPDPAAASFRIGERAPLVIGATTGGAFHSPDAQAGRAAVYLSLGTDPSAAAERLKALAGQPGDLEALGVDLHPLALQRSDVAAALRGAGAGEERVVYLPSSDPLLALEALGPAGFALIDPAGRVVLTGAGQGVDLPALCRAALPALAREAGQARSHAAPVLILPNLISQDFCGELIAHFEASPHRAGLMAGVEDGKAAARLNEEKKQRRDLELTPGEPVHGRLLEVLARACVPEIKRAFNADIGFADRILIARYDETGGYFRRHRDNIAPQTRFREFALSLNLNTGAYAGGEISFPEYDDHRYSPPAGGGLIFSASLLHEALPVTAGRRYVALTFLSTSAAAALVSAA